MRPSGMVREPATVHYRQARRRRGGGRAALVRSLAILLRRWSLFPQRDDCGWTAVAIYDVSLRVTINQSFYLDSIWTSAVRYTGKHPAQGAAAEPPLTHPPSHPEWGCGLGKSRSCLFARNTVIQSSNCYGLPAAAFSSWSSYLEVVASVWRTPSADCRKRHTLWTVNVDSNLPCVTEEKKEGFKHIVMKKL
ncbi:hypothetical protein GN956_G23790 [Arapaima gigas]